MEVLHDKIKRAEERFFLMRDSPIRYVYENELGRLYNELMYEHKLKKL